MRNYFKRYLKKKIAILYCLVTKSDTKEFLCVLVQGQVTLLLLVLVKGQLVLHFILDFSCPTTVSQIAFLQ